MHVETAAAARTSAENIGLETNAQNWGLHRVGLVLRLKAAGSAVVRQAHHDTLRPVTLTGIPPSDTTPGRSLAGRVVHALQGARPVSAAIERLRQGRGLYSLHETIPVARPALLAALYRALGGQIFVAVPTFPQRNISRPLN